MVLGSEKRRRVVDRDSRSPLFRSMSPILSCCCGTHDLLKGRVIHRGLKWGWVVFKFRWWLVLIYLLVYASVVIYFIGELQVGEGFFGCARNNILMSDEWMVIEWLIGNGLIGIYNLDLNKLFNESEVEELRERMRQFATHTCSISHRTEFSTFKSIAAKKKPLKNKYTERLESSFERER